VVFLFFWTFSMKNTIKSMPCQPIAGKGVEDMLDDILTVAEVAEKFQKSPGWVYANAAKLGASKIGGSIIFPKSAVIAALENAQLKPKEAKESKGKPSNVVPIKKKAPNGVYSTDPSKYGIANILYMMVRPEEPEDIFEGIDLDAVIAALKH